jgi:hypothetical protein
MLRSMSAVVLMLFVGAGPVMASEGDVSATPAAIAGPIQKPQAVVTLPSVAPPHCLRSTESLSLYKCSMAIPPPRHAAEAHMR